MRIVQLANFHSPRSGGLRVSVDALGERYQSLGHERLLIVPSSAERRGAHPSVRAVPSVPVPRTPYRLIVDRRPVLRALEEYGPDRVEVSDKATLRWVGEWARDNGLPSVLISHERLDALVHTRAVKPGERAIARWNHRWAEAFDTIVAPSQFAADEFRAVGAGPVVVPWAVRRDVFVPRPAPPPEPLRLVWVGRFSAEKHPDLAVATAASLVRSRIDVELTMIGDGPMLAGTRRRAARLPVTFTGRVENSSDMAARVASHHVFLATGPAETFNIAALEALACGVPVVCADTGATQELVDDRCGRPTPSDPDRFAAAVLDLMTDHEQHRAAARARATGYRWSEATRRMLAVHGQLSSV